MASPGAGGAGRPGWVAGLIQAAFRLPWSYRDELFRLGRQHIKEDHPDMVMSDGQIRDLIAAKAQDS